METKARVLSIDAWRNEGGWEWNAAYTAGEYAKEDIPQTNRKLLKWLRDEGFLTEFSKGKVRVEQPYDSCTEIQLKSTGQPLFAIEWPWN